MGSMVVPSQRPNGLYRLSGSVSKVRCLDAGYGSKCTETERLSRLPTTFLALEVHLKGLHFLSQVVGQGSGPGSFASHFH